MIVQRQNDKRIEYLVRVLYQFMSETPAGDESILYDDAECGGQCLADDFVSELGLDDQDF